MMLMMAMMIAMTCLCWACFCLCAFASVVFQPPSLSCLLCVALLLASCVVIFSPKSCHIRVLALLKAAPRLRENNLKNTTRLEELARGPDSDIAAS